jgi:hypothetical protein
MCNDKQFSTGALTHMALLNNVGEYVEPPTLTRIQPWLTTASLFTSKRMLSCITCDQT